MTAVLTATPQPSNVPPRVLLAVTGMAGATVTITRTGTDGTVTVRTANPGTLTAGAFTVSDYEATFGIAYTYTATSNTADTATASATLTVSGPWLFHLADSTLSMPIRVMSRGERTLATNQGVHTVIGRPAAVVRSDGVRRLPTFPLLVGTSTLAEEAALTAILADSSVLLLQIAYTGVTRAESYYVSVGDVTMTDVADWFGNPFTQWTLPCTVTAVPTGSQQSAWTYAGLSAAFATYATADAAYTTYADMLTDTRI